MRLTKYAHACVAIDGPDGRLVIDPGEWAEPTAFVGAAAILITHEHFDHLDAKRLAAVRASEPELPIFGPSGVVGALAASGIAVSAVAPGQTFAAAGLSIAAVGGAHAEIWCGQPNCDNVGFVIESSIYHPGDSLYAPDGPIETLLVPVSGPWLKTGEAIDFVRAVNPKRAVPIHDALLSEIGQATADRWIGGNTDADYVRLEASAILEW